MLGQFGLVEGRNVVSPRPHRQQARLPAVHLYASEFNIESREICYAKVIGRAPVFLRNSRMGRTRRS